MPSISSNVIPVSSCLQSFPASGSFQMRQLVTSGGHQVVLEFQLQHHSFQRTPRNDLLQNGLVGSPCSPRDSQVFSWKYHAKYHSKASILRRSAFFRVQLSHTYVTTVKTIALTRWTFVGRVIGTCFKLTFWLCFFILKQSTLSVCIELFLWTPYNFQLVHSGSVVSIKLAIF